MFHVALTKGQALQADFVVYTSFTAPSRRIIDVSEEDIIANAHETALDLFVSGASGASKSVYDYDAGKFLCGTIAQLDAEAAR